MSFTSISVMVLASLAVGYFVYKCVETSFNKKTKRTNANLEALEKINIAIQLGKKTSVEHTQSEGFQRRVGHIHAQHLNDILNTERFDK